LAMHRCTVVVELQRDADHVVTLGLEQGSRHRRVDAARHGDNDTRRFWAAIEFETVGHGRSYYRWRLGARNARRQTGKFCRLAIRRAGRGFSSACYLRKQLNKNTNSAIPGLA